MINPNPNPDLVEGVQVLYVVLGLVGRVGDHVVDRLVRVRVGIVALKQGKLCATARMLLYHKGWQSGHLPPLERARLDDL